MPAVMEGRMPQKKRSADNDTEHLRGGSREALRRLFERFQSDFGDASGRAIIKALIEECGGMRICLPDLQDLYREERDRAIRNRFDVLAREVGSSQAYLQLAVNWSMSVWQVRRVVNKSRTTD